MANKKNKEERDWDTVFQEEFDKESDRASVILSAAMLDRALETILKAFLVPLASSEDNLLEGAYGPVSTFNARIDLGYRIGLISSKFCRDLHIIRRIRNVFAHNVTGCSFDHADIRDRIIELKRSSIRISQLTFEDRGVFPEGPKGDFQMVVSWMLFYLSRLSEQIGSIEPATLEFGYVPLAIEEKKE